MSWLVLACLTSALEWEGSPAKMRALAFISCAPADLARSEALASALRARGVEGDALGEGPW